MPKTHISLRMLALCIAQEWTCAYCGTCLKKLKPTIEHVVPRSKGGANLFSNMLTICYHCNQAKWDAMPTAQQRATLFKVHKTAPIIFSKLAHKEGFDFEPPEWQVKRIDKLKKRAKVREYRLSQPPSLPCLSRQEGVGLRPCGAACAGG